MRLLGDDRKLDYPGNIARAVEAMACIVFYGGMVIGVIILVISAAFGG